MNPIAKHPDAKPQHTPAIAVFKGQQVQAKHFSVGVPFFKMYGTLATPPTMGFITSAHLSRGHLCVRQIAFAFVGV
jgi:hypothetical protein